jgi:two-component system, cell cycle response regulator
VMPVGAQVVIVDLGSTNGTEVGGEKLQPNAPRPLVNNDLVKVGNALFKYLEKGNIEAISLKQTFDRTQLDPLTEIYNKAAFLSKAEEMFKRAVLTETPLCEIVFDIDNFKQVNDNHKGKHLAGDYVLKELASIIQNNLIRQNDFFARFGGEEFVLLLAGSPLKRAIEIAERIRSTIEKHPFIYQDEPMKITISVGVATLEANMTTHEQLFEKADQAAYVSKRTGKNRVSTI